jgi:hypothetical protein
MVGVYGLFFEFMNPKLVTEAIPEAAKDTKIGGATLVPPK